MLEEFAPSLYLAEGPTVSFLGFPYPTRMALVRLRDGGVWVWSPVALTPQLESEVRAIGPVRHLVSPNKLHHLFLEEWMGRWPDAQLYAPPGLARRRRDLHFSAQLGDEPEPAWAEDLDQVIVRGSLLMEEVAFFHRPSRTALLCDLVQRHDPAGLAGMKKLVMRLDGLVGEKGSTPREWRASFVRRGRAHAARAQLLAWKPDRLVIAHGHCAAENATQILERALGWM